MTTNITNKNKNANNRTNNTDRQKSVKLALWNANSVNGKAGELEHFIKLHKVDIFAISETKLAPHVDFNITTLSIDKIEIGEEGELQFS